MPTYAILVQPSFNRVYTRDAPTVMTAEIRLIDDLVLDGRIDEIRTVTRGGVPFLELDCPERLSARELQILVNVSGVYLLAEVQGELLAPCEVMPLACYDDDLLTTLRYSGKTNEQFTALLVNLGLASSVGTVDKICAGEPVRVLDPLFGRGTTLNQALMYGLDAWGTEVEKRDFEAYSQFIKTWLQDKRIKHRTQTMTYRKGRGSAAQRLTLTIKRSVGEGIVDQTIDIINDDTLNAREHFRKSSVDAIVGDLPYGIQHAARTDSWGRSRSAAALLEEALPVWRSVLRGGGSLTLAWNRRQIERADMVAAIEAGGFGVVLGDDDQFEHRVDRTITRDVVVAVKPA